MQHLSIDIETRSSVNIAKSGAYKYAQSDDFEILMFSYKLNDLPVQLVDLKQGEKIPPYIVGLLDDENCIKHAYNAAFEWFCLNQAGYETNISQWRCTMVHATYLGLPAGLSMTGNAIGIADDKKKLTTGSRLIQYFSVPCKPTKTNGGRTWNDPHHDLDKWKLYCEYNMQDVEAEYTIYQHLKAFEVPSKEQRLWEMDILMNSKGVKIDKALVESILKIDAESTEKLTEEAYQITELENPNSISQLKSWVESQLDEDLPGLTKDVISNLLSRDNLPLKVKRVLEIRQQLGKTSVSKYSAMENAMCEDDRVRGLLQFYGANRTGRWAGRLVQVQNLPRNYISTLDTARELAKLGNFEGLKILYNNVPDTLSQLVRTAFITSKDKFIISDFSAIEARVIAWLAGEEWVNEVFATHGKIYEATASQMFNVPIDKIKKGNPEYELRQRGKVATLALGYQGGESALIAMGADRMGLSDDELTDIKVRWREANKNIVRLWYAVGDAVIQAMNGNGTQYVRGLEIQREWDMMYGLDFITIKLPSDRKLYYPKPFLQTNQFGKDALHYYGVNQTTKKWEVNSTYGGKLVENIVQAIARDCLAETLLRLYEKNYDVVMHIHDEVVIDAYDDEKLEDVNNILAEPINWAPGLILKGAGFETKYYMKD
ncbi:bifunctional 3'-5' exonuclease/DNA polymerase [Gemella morbillorum]|uniref:DNA polymerase n=1 Tax=Gemella morbillorum TaxID=29391 RepID=UPI000DA33E33|nr:DNA polymerase [Gemella morbillorum]UBH81411.1 DNA polymerase [Gemella morbillorum]SQH55181.1 bifunctional 3'-5' exonuclease/DNA polymerase [Gemella morbillorum]